MAKSNDAPGTATNSSCTVCSAEVGVEYNDDETTIATASLVTDGETLKVLCKVTATLPDPQPVTPTPTADVVEVTSLGGTSTGFTYRA